MKSLADLNVKAKSKSPYTDLPLYKLRDTPKLIGMRVEMTDFAYLDGSKANGSKGEKYAQMLVHAVDGNGAALKGPKGEDKFIVQTGAEGIMFKLDQITDKAVLSVCFTFTSGKTENGTWFDIE